MYKRHLHERIPEEKQVQTCVVSVPDWYCSQLQITSKLEVNKNFNMVLASQEVTENIINIQ